jgi:hypothetical protein
LLDGIKDSVQACLATYTVKNDAKALREAIDRIPGSTEVAAPNYALLILSTRSKLFHLQYLHMYPQARPDYLLIDTNLDRITTNPDLRRRYTQLLDRLFNSNEHEIIWKQGDYFLFRRIDKER